MDKKVAQYLNKDTENILEKCTNKLQISLLQDVNSLCDSYNEERTGKFLHKSDKILERIQTTMRLISDINSLDQNGTIYLGSGNTVEDKNKDIKPDILINKDG